MKDLIYNQHQIPKKQWRYGLRSSAATGCGWIATYNALHLMGYRVRPEKLVRYYVWQLPLIHGNFGTFFLGPAVYFKQHGFKVTITARRKKFDKTAKKSDVCIIYYYWRRKFRIGSHFAAVRYEDGKFTGYNTFSNSSGQDHYGNSLETFLKKQKYFCPVLIAIRDKR